jgi:hypothetical protein
MVIRMPSNPVPHLFPELLFLRLGLSSFSIRSNVGMMVLHDQILWPIQFQSKVDLMRQKAKRHLGQDNVDDVGVCIELLTFEILVSPPGTHPETAAPTLVAPGGLIR